MRRTLPIHLLFMAGFVALLALGSSVAALAQGDPNENIFRIRASDNEMAKDTGTMTFGNNLLGTYGIDTALGENEPPPDPPGFGLKWSALINRPYAPGISYLLNKDLRAVPADPAKKDTFLLKIKNDDVDAVTADLTLSWNSSPADILSRCDSLVLNFSDPSSGSGVPGGRFNLANAGSVTLLKPYAISVDNGGDGWNNSAPNLVVRIIKYGNKIPLQDAVRKESDLLPQGFALHQNYPNPFNPTTNFRFDVRTSGMTDISVYNMLGQKVTTLVARELTAGTYTASWNGMNDEGSSATSGVYFVRMSVRTASPGNDFSAVRKMVLMK